MVVLVRRRAMARALQRGGLPLDIWKRILKMLRPHKLRLTLGLVVAILVIFTQLYIPQVTRSLVDNVVEGGRIEMLVPLIITILLLVLARASMRYFRSWMFERVSQDYVYDVRTGLYDHLSEMPFEFYDKHRIGEIMSRMTGDIEGLRNFVGGGVLQVLENFCYFVGSIIFLFMMNVPLTLVLLVAGPLVVFLAQRYNKKIRPAFSSIREQNATLSNRTQENISGVRVVKAFAREKYEKDMFSKDNMHLLDLHLAATKINANYGPALDVVGSLCTPILILVGGIMTINGQITLGTLVAFNSYLWMIAGPLRMLANLINMTAQASTSAEKLFYYMDFGANIKDKEGAVVSDPFRGHVKFDNVTFGYGDGMVLKNISIDLKPGKSLAIMGATGSGKTSVVNLIARFYDVTEGSITVDDIDVRDWKLKELRSHIGFVMQETFLFSESVENNVKFGRPNETQEAAAEAARMAQGLDFINALPAKWDTVIGERGMGLSGGQKQRVAIARALLINPGILVLDDATSAVDMETEHAIQAELAKAMKDRTTIVIAHRISSVKNADEIIILEGGEIAERGTHTELLEKKGLYYQMVRDQYKDFESVLEGRLA